MTAVGLNSCRDGGYRQPVSGAPQTLTTRSTGRGGTTERHRALWEHYWMPDTQQIAPQASSGPERVPGFQRFWNTKSYRRWPRFAHTRTSYQRYRSVRKPMEEERVTQSETIRTESVWCRENRYELLPGTYYHLPTADLWGEILLWNAWIGEGLLASASAIAIDGVVTRYFIHNCNDPKERLWERIRKREFPTLPSRMKAFFLFDDRDTVRRAHQLWFPNESRLVLEARVVRSTILHKADARWLDARENEWERSARYYWSSTLTDDPMVECIAHGQVYFPRWKEAPFGKAPGVGPRIDS